MVSARPSSSMSTAEPRRMRPSVAAVRAAAGTSARRPSTASSGPSALAPGTHRTSSANSRIDSDGVKLVATTMGKEVADAAIQVLGGYGYVGEYVVERLWRDAKLLEIGGGTLEAHEKNITKDLSRSFEQVLG